MWGPVECPQCTAMPGVADDPPVNTQGIFSGSAKCSEEK